MYVCVYYVCMCVLCMCVCIIYVCTYINMYVYLCIRMGVLDIE